MKFTYDWLKDYLDTAAAPQQIADMLTRIGLEVEDMIIPVPPIAAKIVTCEKHPDSDHLHILQVDDGSGELCQVVCGAPNARAGLVSALARVGSKIGDMEIKAGKIRGVLSNGMMCSSRELGIGDDHDGIIELDENVEVIGQPISDFRSSISALFDAGITPNRPDYLAVRGVAHDLAAAGLGEFKINYNPYNFGDVIQGNRAVTIENYDDCPIYYMCEIRGIKNGPSNSTVASRLAAIGINPRNAPIDTTNYICFDMGQPMHCFDADEINGDIIVRNAKLGEKFTDLFGNEHELVATDLVIADADGILALAGVVGGARGMTTDKTTNIILESAYFNPVTVRKTSKRVGVSTDASYRYERGIDPTISFVALAGAVKIIHDACGGDVQTPYRDYDKTNPIVSGMNNIQVDKEYSRFDMIRLLDPRRIEYNPGLFAKKTGVNMEPAAQKKILEALGYVIEANGDDWVVTPLPARVDVQIAENVISDLIRIYGYENIKQDKNIRRVDFKTDVPAVKKALVERGFYECLNYGFGDLSHEKILSDKDNVIILNPIIDTFDTARNSLVQSMLDTIANNDRFRRSNLSLFELAPVFDGNQPGQQHNQLIIARTGIVGGKMGIKHGTPASIYDIRADLLSLFPNATVETDNNPPMWANPFRAGRLVLNDKTVAVFAELHPMIAKKFGIKTNVVIGLVDDAAGLETPTDWSGSKNESDKITLAEFPLITRDFAFVAADGISPDVLTQHARNADARIIETNVFDVFELPDGNKSIAFEIVIQPTENITDDALMAIQDAVIKSVENNTGAKLRS